MTTGAESLGAENDGTVLRTLLVSDLVDSTALIRRLGDKRAFELFGRHDRLARDLLAEHRGREIDKTDGFLMLFERPVDAVYYALAYHDALAVLGADESVELAARVGIHLGEVYLRTNPPEDVTRGAKPLEVEGLAKPMAARLMSVASGGQTVLTRGAFDLARRAATHGREALRRAPRWMAHGAYALKGLDEPVEVFEVGIVGVAPLRAPDDTDKVRRVAGDGTIVGWRPAPGQDVPQRPRWRLERKLGEGGFGEVWLAGHTKTGEMRVFKFCFESERLRGLQREVTLFRLLRETLGSRPDIARIIDWNFDEAPYSVESEYTEGGSLLEWTEAAGGIGQVPLATRLEVVAQVADALAAAHSVGVLHKDIKPANVLITSTADGVVQAQLTDFGIGLIVDTASLVSAGITAAGFTRTLMGDEDRTTGTLLYMAPELLEGRPATVQADVYAVGVMLYQLVVGSFKRVLAPGWADEIDDELLRSDIAAMVDGRPERRIADISDVARRLRSLPKRREARAQAERQRAEAERLRVALERARRRRKVVAAVGIVLVVFAAAMAVQARRVAREAARANREAATARQVKDFLLSIFDTGDPSGERGRTVTARELLDQGSAKVERELAGDPLTLARLSEAMGASYLQLGLYDSALPLLERAHDTLAARLDDDDLELAAARLSLARLYARQGRFDDARPLLEQVLAARERRLGPDHPEVAAALEAAADLCRAQGRYAEALPLSRRAETILEDRPTATDNAPAVAPSTELLALASRTTLPQDARHVLGSWGDEGVVMARGAQGLHTVDLSGRSAPSLRPMAADEHVVALLPRGGLALRHGSRLVFHHVDHDTERLVERTVLTGLREDERVLVDTAATWAARLGPGEITVYRIERNTARRRLHIELRSPTVETATLGRRFLAWVGRDGVVVHDLEADREVLRARDWEGGDLTLAIDDVGAHLAVGGWFDEVLVYDLAQGRPAEVVTYPGRTASLLFLPDCPTLAIAKHGGLVLWREGDGIVAEHLEPGRQVKDLSFGTSGLLAMVAEGRELLRFRYDSCPVRSRFVVSASSLWTMSAGADGAILFAGAADGQLHRYDTTTGRLSSVQAHTQGVTTSVVRGSYLATGADDRTIAVWDAGSLEEVSRRQAHEFLVNALFWDEAGQLLWSSSSDRTVKAWSWPGLEPVETIELEGVGCADLWVDGAHGLALVGRWDGSWVELRRDDTGWQRIRTVTSSSRGVYSVAAVPGAGVVVLLGVDPNRLWLVDLVDDQVWTLPTTDLPLNWLTAIGDYRLVAVGWSYVGVYSFARDADGSLRYSLAGGLNTSVGDIGIVTWLPAARLLATGTGDGEVVLFDGAALPATPMRRGHLAPP